MKKGINRWYPAFPNKTIFEEQNWKKAGVKAARSTKTAT
jgi:hypothetical protein